MLVSEPGSQERTRRAREQTPRRQEEAEAEPLYVLPEDEAPQPAPESEAPDGAHKKSPFKVMLDIMAGPVQGWKTMRRQRYTPQEVLSRLLYPLTAGAAASQLANLFYDANASIAGVVIGAVVTFIAFFFGYFTVVGVARSLMRKDSGEWVETPFGKEYVAFSMSTLALFTIFLTLLPMLEPVIVFLPLWTIYIVCRGVRFLRVPSDGETRVSIIMSVLIVGTPMAYWWLFSKILTL